MNRQADRKFRISRQKDISRLFRQGRRVRDRLITLYALPNDLHLTRAGVAVSVRHGNAVRRNRIKRLCREAFRAAREDMPLGWDYFVVPSMRAELTVKGLAGSLKSLSAQAARSQPPKDGAK